MASSPRLRNVGSRSACGSGEANDEFTVHMRNREARRSFDNLRDSADDQPRPPRVDPDWPDVCCAYMPRCPEEHVKNLANTDTCVSGDVTKPGAEGRPS